MKVDNEVQYQHSKEPPKRTALYLTIHRVEYLF
jgi:hypothetical protein